MIGGLAYRAGALSAGGLAGAIVLGTSILGLAGWPWAFLLIAFFVSSTLLTHYGRRRKAAFLRETAKGGRRDLAQTFANAGIAALIASSAGLIGSSQPVYTVLALAYAGALAAVNADTWATELGVLAGQQPRLITTGRRVPPGASGGITPVGTLAALAGASFIGVVAALLALPANSALLAWMAWPEPLQAISIQTWIGVAAVAGLGGALFDSLLGATVQATYHCAACNVETERAVHSCGRATTLVRGQRWLDNDWVNFLASAFGAAIGALLSGVMH
jgi:uncharacterized protein (TIGR00297 family)